MIDNLMPINHCSALMSMSKEERIKIKPEENFVFVTFDVDGVLITYRFTKKVYDEHFTKKASKEIF